MRRRAARALRSSLVLAALILAALAAPAAANTFLRDRNPLHQRYEVPDRDLAVAPYSDNLKVRFFFAAPRLAKDCDGFLVESPQILVTPAHCLLERDAATGRARIDPRTGRALIAERVEAYAGFHRDVTGQTYRPLFYKLGSTDPWRDPGRDYAVFRLLNAWPRGVRPLRLDPAVTERAGAIEAMGHSLDNRSRGDVLFLDPYCHTHPETARDLPAWNVVFHDCNFSAEGSGAALFLPVRHDYYLVGMQVAEQADAADRSQFDVRYTPRTANVAVKARTLWADVTALKNQLGGATLRR